jgi:hypothetical protein
VIFIKKYIHNRKFYKKLLNDLSEINNTVSQNITTKKLSSHSIINESLSNMSKIFDYHSAS